jgi:CDP-diacylglycerol--glycerol-3-phosphate 3-phosphatidyltransferase
MNTADCPTTLPKVAPPLRMRINLPNQITLLRLILSIIFFVCLAQFDARVAKPHYATLDVAYILFVIAALTDILDGYLARKYKQITSFGRIIDPVVDKVLVMGAYAFLAGEGFVSAGGNKLSDVSAWMLVVILGRELLVTSLRGVSEASGKSFGANVYGKAKMLLQSITVVWVLATVAHPVTADSGQLWRFLTACRPVLVYLTVAVTFLSMIPYIWSARAVLSQTSASPS